MDFVVVTLRVTLIHHAERDDYFDRGVACTRDEPWGVS